MIRVLSPSAATAEHPHGVQAAHDDWHSTSSRPRLFTLPKEALPLAPEGTVALLLTVSGDALHEELAAILASNPASLREMLDALQKSSREASTRTPSPAHVAELCYAEQPWLTGLVLKGDGHFIWQVQEFPGAALEAGRLSLRTRCAEAGFALEASVLLVPPVMNDFEALAQREFPPSAPTARQSWQRPEEGRQA